MSLIVVHREGMTDSDCGNARSRRGAAGMASGHEGPGRPRMQRARTRADEAQEAPASRRDGGPDVGQRHARSD